MTEAYWSGRLDFDGLASQATQLKQSAWMLMRDKGIDLIPSGDFSFYDHVLDMALLLGVIPERYRQAGYMPHGENDLSGAEGIELYFAMARGSTGGGGRTPVPALEMTKWYDTNYHYIVPEITPATSFKLFPERLSNYVTESAVLGIKTKPVLLGPFTFLSLAKPPSDSPAGFRPLDLLEELTSVYSEVLEHLASWGVEWVQLDEPSLCADISSEDIDALVECYGSLGSSPSRPNVCLSTYFGHVGETMHALVDLPIEGIGLDFCAGPRNLSLLEEAGGLGEKKLFAGVVDGRNIWVNDLRASLHLLNRLRPLAGSLAVSTSCSLMHVPVSLDDPDLEPYIDPELRSCLAFATEKIQEVVTLQAGMLNGEDSIEDVLEQRSLTIANWRKSPRVVDEAVRHRTAHIDGDALKRRSPYSVRRKIQANRLKLPSFPTTTIGSFPQTLRLRSMRAARSRGELDESAYEEEMRKEIEEVIRVQERIGLDVLVHGEPERDDMVRYFASQLNGFALTVNGWVQSFGTRYVRPPIIYGDVSRPHPITVGWATYAQSLTEKPVKGMLTGPLTMLFWSFPRQDLKLSEIAEQIALAIRDELYDLEEAGIAVIQVDEPAFREGLPLRREEWQPYLDWAVRSFKLATSGAADSTQVHTHMCYAEFGDVMEAISELDADVISMEAARSSMEVVGELSEAGYEREVGPGVYDIHSPRVPSREEIRSLLEKAAAFISRDQLWVNPDCGLKTRSYSEVIPALENMVKAAQDLRMEGVVGERTNR